MIKMAKHTVAGISVVHEHKAESIMEQMVMNTEGLIDEEKDKLRRLLREYKSIISLHDGDLNLVRCSITLIQVKL